MPEAHLEVIYVSEYYKVKDERLLSQKPESLPLKREQKVHPILELAKDVGVKTKITLLRGNLNLEIIAY